MQMSGSPGMAEGERDTGGAGCRSLTDHCRMVTAPESNAAPGPAPGSGSGGPGRRDTDTVLLIPLCDKVTHTISVSPAPWECVKAQLSWDPNR